jgi:hypothetical protein
MLSSLVDFGISRFMLLMRCTVHTAACNPALSYWLNSSVMACRDCHTSFSLVLACPLSATIRRNPSITVFVYSLRWLRRLACWSSSRKFVVLSVSGQLQTFLLFHLTHTANGWYIHRTLLIDPSFSEPHSRTYKTSEKVGLSTSATINGITTSFGKPRRYMHVAVRRISTLMTKAT